MDRSVRFAAQDHHVACAEEVFEHVSAEEERWIRRNKGHALHALHLYVLQRKLLLQLVLQLVSLVLLCQVEKVAHKESCRSRVDMIETPSQTVIEAKDKPL